MRSDLEEAFPGAVFDRAGAPPPGPHEIAAALLGLAGALNPAIAEVRERDVEVADARKAHELAYAAAFLSSDGPMDVRKQIAIEATAEEKWFLEVAEAKLRAARAEVKRIETLIDTARSLNAALRAEASTANSGATA